MKIKINAGAVASIAWVLGWLIAMVSDVGDLRPVHAQGERYGMELVWIILFLTIPPVVFGYMWGKDEV